MRAERDALPDPGTPLIGSWVDEDDDETGGEP
jgi:hypothetical protein